MQDQSFDGIAGKFAKNIYGTSKGALRHQLLCDALDELLPAGKLNIIELGGGTGVMSSYLANKGHALTLTDISADILTMAEVPPSVVTYQADLQSVQNLADFDIVLCHAVLEWLADPKAALAHMAKNMRPGSWLSLTFFNKDAALFGNAVYGNFDYIARGMKVKKQVRLNPKQPLSVAQVTEWVEELGFEIAASRGIRCFHDYLRDPKKASEDYESLLALERQYNQLAPFKWFGKYFHLWLRVS